MKYQIGGTFSHRHNGFTIITDVRVSPPGSGLPTKYYFDDDLEDFGLPEEELNKWIKEGWVYNTPEYWEKKQQISFHFQEWLTHQYPKK